MRKFISNYLLLLAVTVFLSNKTHGQAFIEFSTMQSAVDSIRGINTMEVVDGETYTLDYKFVPDGFDEKWVVTKYARNGSVLYSTNLATLISSYVTMKIINGEVYIIGGMLNPAGGWGYPIKIVVIKLLADGTLVYENQIGGDAYIPYMNAEIIGNEILVSGQLWGNNFPITMGSIPPGEFHGFLAKINTADGQLTRSMMLPFDIPNYSNGAYAQVENGFVYVGTSYAEPNLPVTIGSVPVITGNTAIYVQKLQLSDFSTAYARYISGEPDTYLADIAVNNGELYLAGSTMSTAFPVTNGTTLSFGGQDGYFMKLNTNAGIAYSSYLAQTNFKLTPQRIKLSGGNIYLTGVSEHILLAYDDGFICKLNPNYSIAWMRQLNAIDPWMTTPAIFEVVNDEVYIAGHGAKPAFPITNGMPYPGWLYYEGTTGFYAHFNSGGAIVYATFVRAYPGSLQMQVDNNKVYLAAYTDSAYFPSTDGSSIHGSFDMHLMILEPGGTTLYSGYIGGDMDEFTAIKPQGNDVYLGGWTQSHNYPLTENIILTEEVSSIVTKLSFCPDKFAVDQDTLSPKIQTVCKYGLGDTIRGPEIIVPGDSLPTIYLNGVATLQQPFGGTKYQWQTATALIGPWTDIPNATSKDHRPMIGGADQYFRRKSFSSDQCGNAFIHFSDTVTVLAGTLTAPTLDGGSTFVTCPSFPVVIGGNPTASGGNPPYTYNWDFGLPSTPNPTASPLTNTIYTLNVTDAAGCQQITQAVVLVYKAIAGPDKSSCAGAPVRIGAPAITGVPGIVYAWQPATGLTATNIAQPYANPPVQTSYDLTLTVPASGGGVCITRDTVIIKQVAAPVIANFAGPDRVVCFGNPATIGTAPEAGFSYTWSPLNYIAFPNSSSTTYNPGPYAFSLPDPISFRLKAYRDGCTFTDDVEVATIEARAGNDICLGGIIGMPDRTPAINETYSWVKVSGPGNFTGATNLPQVPVNASAGGTTLFGLTVSYNGGSCYDEVAVFPNCGSGGGGGGGGGCIEIHVSGCPGFTANNGNIAINAYSAIPDAVYTWLPQQGLSTYTGNTVYLTDNISRTYTVTATSTLDSSIHCSDTITTNTSGMVRPVFAAPDTAVCAGASVMIGQPFVPGYTYAWAGSGLSSYFDSNPTATVNSSTEFYVTVTNGSGCQLRDTVAVFVQDPSVNAGDDWLICSNGLVTLGTTGIPNTTYLWEPQASAWQNGTDQFSANPQVLAATDVTYTVTATTPAGCVSTDEVNVTVNNSPVINDIPDVATCLGTGGVWIGNPPLPGVTYQWTPATGLDFPNIAQPTANPAVTTTYTVMAIFGGNCALPATDIVTVTVNSFSFSMPDIHFCPGDGPVQVGINAPAGMNYYYWQPQEVLTAHDIANPSTTNPPPVNTTNFTLTVLNNNGCAYTDTMALIPLSGTPPEAGINRNACKGQPIQVGSAFNATAPTISYSWNPVDYLDDPTSPHPVFTGTTVGTFHYALTKTDNSIPCSVTDSIVINVVDILPALSSPTVCRNSCVQIGTSPLTGILYQWSPANGLSNPSISNPLACIDTSTVTYTLTANDQSGCTISTSLVVGVNAVPGLQASIPDVIACVGDANTTFNPSVPAGSYSYLWSPDNGTLSNINIANPVIQTTVAGAAQYSLEITDNSTGCSNTITGNVQVNNCPLFGEAGNFMWFDLNENGIQDNNEPGVSGTTVKLYNSVDFNVATTVTDANGAYSFSSVVPGNGYYIVFSKPGGYDFTTQNVGGITATNNSKADVTGRTGNFNLATGDDISNMDAGIIPTEIVPVTLLSFTARLQTNKTVLLNWQTTAEINNDHFDVERSTDGLNFNFIGRVAGNGTTSLPHSYSLIDPAPASGLNYYRLRQVDLDGHFTFSHIEVVELKNNDAINAWYSAQNNSIQIQFSKVPASLLVKLYAANGQLVKSVTSLNNVNAYQLQLPVLARGVYMLELLADGVRWGKKLFLGR